MSSMRPLAMVVAATRSGGIGLKGSIPWRLPKDMAFFKQVTSTAKPTLQNAVIMGRRTWESIPAKFRPLPKRLNIVLTSKPSAELCDTAQKFPNVQIAASLQGALKIIDASPLSESIDKVFVIGGAQVYTEALSSARCKTVYLTQLETDVVCDVSIPAIDMRQFKEESVSEEVEENSIKYRFHVFQRITGTPPPTPEKPSVSSSEAEETKEKASTNQEEQQYLNLIRDIIDNGVQRGDRTGVGTLSKFGCSMRFSLRNKRFPLLTTKRVFWRGLAEELIWFISGSTNAKILSDKGIKIWDGNGSKEYLTSIGLGHREEMDLGPVYGFQWRHFGAEYKTMHDDYTGKGVDQLANVISTIKKNPNDRRIVLSAWNPSALKEMALPPCHMFCQFYVANGELSCQMYQRSCDMGLGVPFNIASYALLTRLIAQVCGLEAGEFIHVLGDAHVYSNHVEALKKQLQRDPREFPTLDIDPSIKDIDDFRFEHFTLNGYKPHAKLDMSMAV